MPSEPWFNLLFHAEVQVTGTYTTRWNDMTPILGHQDAAQGVWQQKEAHQSKVNAATEFCYLLNLVDFDSCAECLWPSDIVSKFFTGYSTTIISQPLYFSLVCHCLLFSSTCATIQYSLLCLPPFSLLKKTHKRIEVSAYYIIHLQIETFLL